VSAVAGLLSSPVDRQSWAVAAPGCTHPAVDTERLELLPHREPAWRVEIAHAVLHLGLVGAVRRLAPGRR
jgi:hypothetical protein